MTTNALPADALPASAPPTRLCGRCRRAFPIDDTIDRPLLPEWWACPSCTASLLPSRQRASTTSNEHPAG